MDRNIRHNYSDSHPRCDQIAPGRFSQFRHDRAPLTPYAAATFTPARTPSLTVRGPQPASLLAPAMAGIRAGRRPRPPASARQPRRRVPTIHRNAAFSFDAGDFRLSIAGGRRDEILM